VEEEALEVVSVVEGLQVVMPVGVDRWHGREAGSGPEEAVILSQRVEATGEGEVLALAPTLVLEEALLLQPTFGMLISPGDQTTGDVWKEEAGIVVEVVLVPVHHLGHATALAAVPVPVLAHLHVAAVPGTKLIF
jgi:hypothetical protein